MKKSILKNRIVSILLFVAILFSIIPMVNIVNASEDEAGFYVSANLPKNQLDDSASYFDLEMKPEQKQTISVDIYNEKSKEMKISVYAANASSNSNGIIDYTKQGIKDNTLVFPFEEIAMLENPVVKIPASSKETVNIELNMPKDEYEGIILGGLVFTEVADKKENENVTSMSIDNTISYALAIKLSEKDTPVEIDLSLDNVEAKTINYEPVIVHDIRNSAMSMSTKMDINVEISHEETGKTVFSHEDSDLSIAPNSLMPYSVSLKGKNIEAGDYVSKVNIKYKNKQDEEEVITFEKEFSVKDELANKVKEYNKTSQKMPTWAKIIIVFLVILIASVVALIIMLVVRNKKRGTFNQK